MPSSTVNLPLTTHSLRKVRVGDEGRLVITGAVGPAVQRLMSMGLMPGTWVRVSRVAPLGDPIILECPGLRLSLRKGEAEGLSLEKDSAASGPQP